MKRLSGKNEKSLIDSKIIGKVYFANPINIYKKNKSAFPIFLIVYSLLTVLFLIMSFDFVRTFSNIAVIYFIYFMGLVLNGTFFIISILSLRSRKVKKVELLTAVLLFIVVSLFFLFYNLNSFNQFNYCWSLMVLFLGEHCYFITFLYSAYKNRKNIKTFSFIMNGICTISSFVLLILSV